MAYKVLTDDSVFVGATWHNKPPKLAAGASANFPVKVQDPRTVTIQRINNSVGKISLNLVAKTMSPRPNLSPEPPHALHDHSRNSNLPVCRHSCPFASHGFTLKEGDTGGTTTNFDDLSAPLHDAKYYRALNCIKFLRHAEYGISRILDGPKQVPAGPKYCTRFYGHDSSTDTIEPINHIPRSHAHAYCKRKKLKSPKKTDWCITGLLSPPSSKTNI